MRSHCWLSALGVLFATGCQPESPSTATAVRALDDPPPESRLVTTGEVAWARFGSSLAIDGDVLVSAAPGDDLIAPVYSGAVFVFARDPSTDQWHEQKQLVPDDLTAYSNFGAAIAVDGDLVAATLPTDVFSGDDQLAAIYVFARDQGGAGQWGRVGRITDPAIDMDGELGTSLALAGDLLAARAVTASGDETVMIFERDRGGPNAWGKVATLREADLDTGGRDELFGSALAFDGDQLLVGAPPVNWWTGQVDGSAYLFARDPVDRDRWTFASRLAPAETGARNDGFGGPIALRGDTAVVGARWAEGNDGDDRSGAAYVFRRDPASSAWNQVDRLTPADGGIGDSFGDSLALAGDALVVGASERWSQRGAAYVFRRATPSTDVWTEELRLAASDGVAGDSFAAAVALHGDTALIGAPRRDGAQVNVNYFGAVYLYDVSIPPPPPCTPASEPNEILTAGGTVSLPSGFSITASPGSLTEPLDVWVEEVPAPADAPLTSVTPIGSYYEVGGRCTAVTPPDQPFVVEFPVPAGADPTRLMAAVLVPPWYVADGPRARRVWSTYFGTYDAARATYAATLTGLAMEGFTFVLVETDQPVAPSARAGSAALAEECSDPPGFEVTCQVTGGGCPDATVLDEAELAYQSFISHGFQPPYLRKVGCNYHLFIRSMDSEACRSDSSGAELGGSYQWWNQVLSICQDPQSPFSEQELRHHTRHELFHAFHYTYLQARRWAEPPGPSGLDPDKWISDGMAEAAIASDAAMQRVDTSPLRDVGTSLLATGSPAYQAQDFWVHMFTATVDGQRRAYPMDYLTDFMRTGRAKTRAIAEMMRHPVVSERYRELGDEYWAWAKNQVFEKTDVTFGGELTNPCSLERGLEHPLIGAPAARLRTPTDREFHGQFESPLQTKWVAIKLRDPAQNITIQVTGDSVAYKVYWRDDPRSCIEIPDGEGWFSSLPDGAELVVLIANKSYSSAGEFHVSITGEDG